LWQQQFQIGPMEWGRKKTIHALTKNKQQRMV